MTEGGSHDGPRRIRLLGALILLLVILGLAVQNGRALALALPLLVYLGAGILPLHRGPKLTAARALTRSRVSAEETVTVTVTVTNQGLAIDELLLEDHPPPSLAILDGVPRSFTSLPTGATVQWSYEVSGNRGEHVWQSLTFQARRHGDLEAHLGEISADSRLMVLPRFERLGPVVLRPRQTRGFAGPIPARTAGSGVSFYGVREYRTGDPLHWINWRLSARRTGTVYTNEFEQERIADVGIVLDARAQSYPDRDEAFEAAVMAAGSLSDRFLDDGNRVALLIYGYSWERVHPGYGRVQKERIHQRLAEARTGTNYALESLEYLPTRMFPSRSQIVMVSPLQSGDGPVFRALRAKGYSVLLVSPDPVSDERAHGGTPEGRKNAAPRTARSRSTPTTDRRRIEARELALRIVGLERAILLSTLRRVGVQVIDWNPGDPLSGALRAGLAPQPLGRAR